MERKHFSAAAVCVMQTFYSELYDSGLFDELKTITTVIQMYSNSLLSRSIQTPKSAVTDTSLLFTNASCFGNTQKKVGAWPLSPCNSFLFFPQMIQLKACEDDERDVE